MKKSLFFYFIFLILISPVIAGDIYGTVFLDINGNGVRDPSEAGIASIIVTDGMEFTRTEQDGSYRIASSGEVQFIQIHEPISFRAAHRFHRFSGTERSYDFALSRVPVSDSVRFLHFGDPETENMSGWVDDVRGQMQVTGADFLVPCGDLCGLHGLVAHSKSFAREVFPYDVMFVVGNHDILKSEPGAYGRLIGPYYYSFERGPLIFVVAPMRYGDIGPMNEEAREKKNAPYSMQQFGSWLEKLLALLPRNQPKFLLTHSLPNESISDAIAYETLAGKKILLSEHSFTGAATGHRHVNCVRRHPHTFPVFTTSHPNMGGGDLMPGACRLLEFNPDSTEWTSQMIWNGLRNHLVITSPSEDFIIRNDNGLSVSVVAYNSPDPVNSVVASCGGKETSLTSNGGMAWSGTLPLAKDTVGEANIKVTAKTMSGNSFSKEAALQIPPHKTAKSETIQGEWKNFLGNPAHNGVYPDASDTSHLKIRFIAPVKGEIVAVSPIVMDGRVFIASADNGNGNDAGVYAFDAVTGAQLWFYRTGYSVLNSIAAADGRVFALDARGRTHGIDAVTGSKLWITPTTGSELRLFTCGITCDGERVYTGIRSNLSALDPASGKVLWNSKDGSLDDSPGSTITVKDGLLCAVTDYNGGLYVYDSSTGKELWRQKLRRQNASPVIDEGKIYARDEKRLLIFDARTGAFQEYPCKDNLSTSTTPVLVSDELLLVTSIDSLIIALDRATLSEVWRCSFPTDSLLKIGGYRTWNRKRGSLSAGAVMRGNTIWIGNADGFLYAINAKTGKILAQYNLGMAIFSAPAFAGNRLYIADFSGRLFSFELITAKKGDD